VVHRNIRWKISHDAWVIGMWWGIDKAREVKKSHDRKERFKYPDENITSNRGKRLRLVCAQRETCRGLLDPREPIYRIL
jgi:hypothetical protein